MKCEKCGFHHDLSPALKCELDAIAANFEMRARNIAMHNQRSHTSNTQQRKNMEIMHQVWSDATLYVRDQIKKMEPAS